MKGIDLMNNEVLELINKREGQILFHSCIYYQFNDNVVSDYIYDEWANELLELIKKYPQEFEASKYYIDFKNYTDCPSGFNLPYAIMTDKARAYLIDKGKLRCY